MPTESLGGIPDILMGKVKHGPLNGQPNQKGTAQNNHDRAWLLPACCFLILLIIVAFDIVCHRQCNVANGQPICKVWALSNYPGSFSWWPLLHDQNPAYIVENTRTGRIAVDIFTDATWGLDFFSHAVWGSWTYAVVFSIEDSSGQRIRFIRGLKIQAKQWVAQFDGWSKLWGLNCGV